MVTLLLVNIGLAGELRLIRARLKSANVDIAVHSRTQI
jgi:hypothetical protein